MSLSQFALADMSLAQAAEQESSKKPPSKRVATALTDQRLVAEPR